MSDILSEAIFVWIGDCFIIREDVLAAEIFIYHKQETAANSRSIRTYKEVFDTCIVNGPLAWIFNGEENYEKDEVSYSSSLNKEEVTPFCFSHAEIFVKKTEVLSRGIVVDTKYNGLKKVNCVRNSYINIFKSTN